MYTVTVVTYSGSEVPKECMATNLIKLNICTSGVSMKPFKQSFYITKMFRSDGLDKLE